MTSGSVIAAVVVVVVLVVLCGMLALLAWWWRRRRARQKHAASHKRPSEGSSSVAATSLQQSRMQRLKSTLSRGAQASSEARTPRGRKRGRSAQRNSSRAEDAGAAAYVRAAGEERASDRMSADTPPMPATPVRRTCCGHTSAACTVRPEACVDKER